MPFLIDFFEISDIQLDRVAERKGINANSRGGFAEKLFDCLRVVAELLRVPVDELFLCQRNVGKLIARKIVGLIIAKSYVSVSILKNEVDNTLNEQRLADKLLLEFGIGGKFRCRKEEIEALLAKNALC